MFRKSTFLNSTSWSVISEDYVNNSLHLRFLCTPPCCNTYSFAPSLKSFRLLAKFCWKTSTTFQSLQAVFTLLIHKQPGVHDRGKLDPILASSCRLFWEGWFINWSFVVKIKKIMKYILLSHELFKKPFNII